MSEIFEGYLFNTFQFVQMQSSETLRVGFISSFSLQTSVDSFSRFCSTLRFYAVLQRYYAGNTKSAKKSCLNRYFIFKLCFLRYGHLDFFLQGLSWLKSLNFIFFQAHVCLVLVSSGKFFLSWFLFSC